MINNEVNFKSQPIIPSYECLNSCLVNYLSHYIKNISGSDIFYIGEGYHIYFDKGSISHIYSTTYDANFNFLNKFNISYNFLAEEPTKHNLITKLKEKYPLVLRLSADALTYHKVFEQASEVPHFINIIEYNTEKDYVYIMDGAVPTLQPSTFEGWVKVDDLVKAWERMNGEYIQFDFENMKEGLDIKQLKALARVGLQESISKYIEGKKAFFSRKQKGIKSFYLMIDELEKYIDSQEYRKLAWDVNYQLKISGVINSKYFLLEKLKELDFDEVIQEEYKKIISEWSKWCLLILKSGISPSPNRFSNIKQKMEECIVKETEILKNIQERL